MTNQTVDTSDAHYADVLSKALEAYEKYLQSGSSEDVKAWVELDRERAKIYDIRQYKLHAQAIAKGDLS